MMKFVFAFFLCLAPCFAFISHAQTYTIKTRKNPPVGKKVVQHEIDVKEGSVKVSFMGQLIKEDNKGKEIGEEKYTLVVLEAEKGIAKKFTKTYHKAVTTKNGKASARSYQGRTVIFQRKGDEYEVTVKRAPPLKTEDVALLRKQAKARVKNPLREILLPKKPVKVGEVWKVDASKFAEQNSEQMVIDGKKSTGTGKLVRAYKKGAAQWGVLEFNLKLVMPKLGQLALGKPLVYDIKLTADTPIDASSTLGTAGMASRMSGKTTFTQQGRTFTIELDFRQSVNAKMTAK